MFLAAVCAVMLAVWAPASFAQEAPPVDTGGPPVVIDPPPPPPEPIPEPPPPPPDPPVLEQLPPDPAPEPAPPAPEPEPTVRIEPAPEGQRSESAARQDSVRTPAAVTTQTSATVVTPAEALAPPAELPPAGPGEDWAWTDQGDAFTFGTGGTDCGDEEGVVLGSFTRFASIATAAAGIPSLTRQQAAQRAAQHAGNTGSGVVLVDNAGNTMLFFNLFGGGGGGGAALVMLTALGLLAVFRAVPPDWTRAFRNTTVFWWPSPYVPPIEHPG